MRVVIAGGHGKIGLRLARLLADRGDTAVGLIRDPGQAAAVRAAGAEPVPLDLERATADALTARLAGADAAVFAAGAGPGSGIARKDTVDRGAAVLLAAAAQTAGVRRVLQISSMGAGRPVPPDRDPVWAAYLAAKTAAEQDLRDRDLDWVIVRPGRLTDEPGTGLVALADVEREPELGRGEVTRDDVAAVLAELLAAPSVRRRTLDLLGGRTPVAEAVAALG